MKRVVIVGARRTPQGRFLGGLAGLLAIDLACAASDAALQSAGAAAVDLVIVGNVLGAGLGMNVARQVGVRVGVPLSAPAFTVNMMCASGLQAVILAVDAIRSGAAEVVLCGGTESMSNAPHVLAGGRGPCKPGDRLLIDTLLRDGLLDAFSHEPMGATAERLASLDGVTREAQDVFALRSQQQYAEACAAGRFAAEIVTTGGLAADEHPRPDITPADLARLKPVCSVDGTVTAGNSSGINDGAAILVVTSEDRAVREGWPVLAVIEAAATAGCDPQVMGLGPVHATQRLCAATGTRPEDFDLVELNEAFAAQALACINRLGFDAARVNCCGGAIALGHPIGATGARLVVHLSRALAQAGRGRALATLCVGGGMGAALALAGRGNQAEESRTNWVERQLQNRLTDKAAAGR